MEKRKLINTILLYRRGYDKGRISYKLKLVLSDNNSKFYLCNIMEIPCHVDFSDEMTVALSLADGAVLVVDAVEGVNMKRVIRHVIEERISIVLVINKVAESLERGLVDDIENNIENVDWSTTELANFLQTKYDWDLPAARSIWEFGPDKQVFSWVIKQDPSVMSILETSNSR
ncbi:110 kDa U5 small nuclear ribonucleoprotein component CLO-like [Solanum dulcamara]|uniref:110 kDa U5 small nuclear ribonucleoprotein component CLO-like n=1 Tax=Solanum dulcamara TaxID=45834 RepID=UPI002484ED5E|nr:110 kDa U5 small nuclear ribonucleoprotein component CLO-like [Solanum dulcamara]